MNKMKLVLEQYLKVKMGDKTALKLIQLEKLRDGWESDNYLLNLEYGVPRISTQWVWRIYSGDGSQAKAVHEFSNMEKIYLAGYPVPRVLLLETENSPVERPFMVMEYVPGEMMWQLLDIGPDRERARLIDQFCRLFVQLHALDWRIFDDHLPDNDPYFFIDRWLAEATNLLGSFPEVDATSFIEWVKARRELFACAHPSPVHQDFHPGNILIREDGSAAVIDWTSFAVSDARIDLAWTLLLAYSYGPEEFRDEILQRYEFHAGKSMEQIEMFEVLACARRLFYMTAALSQGTDSVGMNAQSVEAIRANMEPHRRVYRLFTERTGLDIEAFEILFGNIPT